MGTTSEHFLRAGDFFNGRDFQGRHLLILPGKTLKNSSHHVSSALRKRKVGRT